jgi:hypothetical protein
MSQRSSSASATGFELVLIGVTPHAVADILCP